MLRYSPSAVLVGSEPGTFDKIKADRIGGHSKPDNFVLGASGCSNNWAKGRFIEDIPYYPCTHYAYIYRFGGN